MKIRLTYFNIFQHLPDNQHVKRILIKGEAGIGKTTMLQGLCCMWAYYMNLELKHSLVKPPLQIFRWLSSYQYSFNEYDVMFFVQLSLVRLDMSLCDAIYDQIVQAYELPKHLLCDYIKNNHKNIAILLDGYDEYNANTSKELTDIIHRKRYKSSLVIVTTRPTVSSAMGNRKTFDKIYSVTGFSYEQVNLYLENYFSTKPHTLHKLRQKIFLKSHIETELLKVPMIVHFICYLWNTEGDLPSTTTELYDKLVEHSLNIDSDKGLMTPAGHFAFLEAVAFSLKDHNFFNGILDEIIDIPAITGSSFVVHLQNYRPVSCMPKYLFIHTSFYEYFLASHISNMNKTVEAISELLNGPLSGGNPALHSSKFMFLQQFLCGMTQSSNTLRVILNLYISHFHSEIQIKYPACNLRSTYTEGLLKCFTEGNGTSGILSMITDFNQGKIVINDLSRQVLQTYLNAQPSERKIASYCKSSQGNSIQEYLSRCLQYITSLEELYIGSNGTISEFDRKPLQSNVHIRTLKELHIDVFHYEISAKYLQEIIGQIPHLHQLKSLGFFANLHGLGNYIAQMLCQLSTKLESLYIHQSKMDENDWEALSHSFHCLHHIKVLYLTENSFGDYFPLSYYNRTTLSMLTKLSLKNSNFSSVSTKLFSHNVRSMTGLQYINMINTKFSSEIRKGFYNFKHLTSLRELHVNNLAHLNMELIVQAIRYLNYLHILDIGWLESSYDSLMLLSDALQFVSCTTAKNDFVHSGNNFIFSQLREYEFADREGILVTFFEDLKAESGLYALELQTPSITSAALQTFAENLHFLGACELRTLKLLVNNFPENGFLTLMARFKHLPHLSCLQLSGLTNDNAKRLPQGLKYLVALEELKLSNCELGDFVTELVNKALPSMPTLKLVDFTDSSLSNSSLLSLKDLITNIAKKSYQEFEEHCFPVNVVILKQVKGVGQEFMLDLCQRLCQDFSSISEELDRKVGTSLILDDRIANYLRIFLDKDCFTSVYLGKYSDYFNRFTEVHKQVT